MAEYRYLEPCPYCGNMVRIVQKGNSRVLNFECPPGSACVGSGLITCCLEENIEAAIVSWNTRTNEPVSMSMH